MSPLITAYTPPEIDFFNKPIIEEVRAFIPKEPSGAYYFLVTDILNSDPFSLSENVLTYSFANFQTPLSDHYNLIAFANMMFKDSKPMSGPELRVLKNTASRLLSKTPTSLRKK